MTYSLAQIAHKFSLELDGDGDLDIVGLCGLSDNLEKHLSFVTAHKFHIAAESSNIPAFVTRPDCRIAGKANLYHPNPDYAMAQIASLFVAPAMTQNESRHPSAVIAPSADIAPDAIIGPHCVIGADTVIGARSRILPGCVIMDRVRIGCDCVIYPQCTIREDCVLEDRVILQPGVMVGGDGFGFVKHGDVQVKVPQLGHVVIESDVEIGANSTIDRGRFSATRIGAGTKIDNSVMIAHNVQIGKRCLIIAQTGISGSSCLGNDVVLAGQCGLVGHINVTDNVTVLGQSMVTKNIREAGVWAGSPARPAQLWKRAIARLYAGLRTD